MGQRLGQVVRRTLQRLTPMQVKRAAAGDFLADGGGLYLQVGPSGAKSWIFRYKRSGRSRDMGLGALHTISLADARDRAQAQRKLLVDGIDPLDARNAARRQQSIQRAKVVTFADCAKAYVDAHQIGWRNPKHIEQWRNTLDTYAAPVLGQLPIDAIDTGLVMQVLDPIWRDKTETATRVRGRMERILSWATVRGHRSGDNPARWRGHLDQLLPAPSTLQKVDHHAALPYSQIGAFMLDLRAHEGVAARALEYTILKVSRTIEAIGARWPEFDFAEKVWVVPAERMKAGRQHRVPLTADDIKLLKALPRVGDYVFPGASEGRPISNMSMAAVLKRMGRSDITVHGFRSTFRDWAAETTNHPNIVVEMALAHTIESKVEAAYRRGDLFEKRRRLMADWAKYCYSMPVRADNVVSLKTVRRLRA